MSWTNPKTWLTGEVMTASDLNVYLKDNLNALRSLGKDNVSLDLAANLTTTMTNFVDADTNNLKLTVVTSGGDLLIGFTGSIKNTTAGAVVWFDVTIDNERIGGTNGLLVLNEPTGTPTMAVALTVCVVDVPAGTYIIRLQWCVSSGSATLYCSGATGGGYINPQFWAREIS